MKKTPETIPDKECAGSVLSQAHALMKQYTLATGAHVCIHDHNYIPIAEQFEELLEEKDMCVFCIKHRKKIEVRIPENLSANPCREIHINAIRESHRFGGSYTYVCELGFVFWTSPVYFRECFSGALVGGGFLGISAGEVSGRIRDICGDTLSETELKRITRFPQAGAGKLKALAELLLVCAQSLSVESEGVHAALKRRMVQQSSLSEKIEEMKDHYPPGSPRPDYPLDKERKLLEVLRRGDDELGKQILNEILASLVFSYPDQFKNIRYRAIELAVLISRMETGSGFAIKTILEANNRNLKSIEEANTIEELTDALHSILDETIGQIRSFHGIQHASALKKAERYILENFTRKLSLNEIAKASGFSAPYFSTIFKEEMGENLSSYLNRLRVEKADYLLMDTNLSLTNIAHACGFEDQSWFSKIFKHYTGLSPGKRRNQRGSGVGVSLVPETVFSDEYRLLLEKSE